MGMRLKGKKVWWWAILFRMMPQYLRANGYFSYVVIDCQGPSSDVLLVYWNILAFANAFLCLGASPGSVSTIHKTLLIEEM